jgi:NarL family two-component system response regulator LiaR
MKRVSIVADDAFVVQAIRLALQEAKDVAVVGVLDGRGPVGRELLDLHPEVVVVDEMENRDDALARLREVREVAPDATALLLTLSRDQAWIDQAVDAGAQTVLSKTEHPRALGTVLRAV